MWNFILPVRSSQMRGIATCLAVAILLVALGAGCGLDEPIRTTESLEAGTNAEDCDDPGGPPTPEVMRCRLLKNSARGAYGRRLSDDDADAIMAAIARYSEAVGARRDDDLSDESLRHELDAANAICESRAGMTCDAILFEPVN